MNIAIAQSGGPTCAINSSLLGIVKKASVYKEIEKIYGSLNGIEGVINDNLVDLKTAAQNEDFELLKQTPATVLGSCRYKLPDPQKDSAVYNKIIDCFKAHNIKAFFYIGGNDSMDTVNKLSEYFKENSVDIRVIGVPKTIDNDLCETDHTPGFGSAAKYVATSLKEIVRDSAVYDLKAVTIVEIMGRHAGWLAASSAILHADGEVAPHLIYLPECRFNIETFLKDISEKFKTYKSVIVAISEGIDLSTVNAVRTVAPTDSFGHVMLSGAGKILENIVKERLGCKVRSIELNVLQRCASHISSLTDIKEAEEIGSFAVEAMMSGETGKTVVFKRISNEPYTIKIETADASKVANSEKFFPLGWINEAQNNVKDEALDYFLPLIQGEQAVVTKNGLPIHYKL